MSSLPAWAQQLLPIVILIAVILVVISRLPKVQLGHSAAFTQRRFFNWFPLGMTYAFLYMGRYNLTVSKNALPPELMTNADFGLIFGVGAATYGVSFLLNGPLTDRLGGRKTIMISAAGTAAMNILMGLFTWVTLEGLWVAPGGLVAWFVGLYALNMYFQSFGAVSIVKVNASWFHVRERGLIGGVFGILISLGLYFAFDWGRFIVTNAPTWWVFFVPAAILLVLLTVDYFAVFDRPSDVGHPDFDTADASSGDDGARLSVGQVFAKMLSDPVIVTIAVIEFFSGFLRNAMMHWYTLFSNQTGIAESFVSRNWGMLQCAAGITGGVVAGLVSDRVFNSRRGPMAAILYGVMTVGAAVMFFALGTPALGWTLVLMMVCIIGVHGMLSGTASMDFGGKKNAGTAVGIIDGMVYAGTALQALVLGNLLPKVGAGAEDPANWKAWPAAMIPAALIGLLLGLRVWNAKPKAHAAPAAAPAPVEQAGAAAP